MLFLLLIILKEHLDVKTSPPLILNSTNKKKLYDYCYVHKYYDIKLILNKNQNVIDFLIV